MSYVQRDTRLFDLSPSTYDEGTRSVTAVLSTGSSVQRSYGKEQLEISSRAIDLSRLHGAGIPVLDSHQYIGLGNLLGRLDSAWVDSAAPALMGRIAFNDTPQGREADGLVRRRELRAVSIGYKVADWAVHDADGNVINPRAEPWRAEDDDLIFTATNWQLLELSLVAIPADPAAGIRADLVDRAVPHEVVAAGLQRLANHKRKVIIEEVCRRKLAAQNTRARMRLRAAEARHGMYGNR